MRHILGLLACVLALSASAAETLKPLKVFILAGQSNMEGHAKVETFDYIGDDPATAPLLQQMRAADGKPAVCDHVWISYLTGIGESNGEGFGKLTAGYGSRQKPAEDGGKIGPEFTFGLTMDAALHEPVLIIKTAWGGKSLNYDFRPPSAGPYPRTAADIEKDRNPTEQAGHYYRLMIEHVQHVLRDIRRVCPVYDEKQGFDIAGFVWLQGFNDMVDRNIYPSSRRAARRTVLPTTASGWPISSAMCAKISRHRACPLSSASWASAASIPMPATPPSARRWPLRPPYPNFRKKTSPPCAPPPSGTKRWEPSRPNTSKSGRWSMS